MSEIKIIKTPNIVSESLLNDEDIKQVLTYIGRYGSNTKFILGVSSQINSLICAMETSVNEDKYIFPGTEDVWELKHIEIDGVKWVFMADDTMDDMTIAIVDEAAIGRQFIGIEKEDNYFKIAENRICFRKTRKECE